MSAPAELRAAYREESTRLCWQAARTACLLAIPLVPVFALLDVIVFPMQAAFFLQLRLACTAYLGLILWLLHRPVGRRHPLLLGVLLANVVGLMIDLMTLCTGGETSPYYAGVNLVLITVALVMPWPLRWSAFTALTLLGGYLAPIVAGGDVADARMLVNNLYFLVTTALIAVVGTGLRERLRFQDFANRAALQEALRHKDDFMARMSHELRTPVHVMVGYADILLEDALAEGGDGARQLVERIRGHGVLLH